jgi:hypothetical protein
MKDLSSLTRSPLHAFRGQVLVVIAVGEKYTISIFINVFLQILLYVIAVLQKK